VTSRSTSSTDRVFSGPEAVVSSTVSDSHMWNLVYLQLLLEEHGFQVTNLGPCVPPEALTGQCTARVPDLIVLSSVNGHGAYDGLEAARSVRAVPALAETPMVIGGKLGIDDKAQGHKRLLREAGFDAVFADDEASLETFKAFLETLVRRSARTPKITRASA
jgi:methylaspartate mutase sigma subunit